jgi:hypothetical protein
MSTKVENSDPHDLWPWWAIAQPDILFDVVRDRLLWRPERGIEAVSCLVIIQYQF